jgi:hypothetical protein
MQELYEHLQQISTHNEEKRLNTQLEYQKEQDCVLKGLIERLTNDILEGYVGKMTVSSEQGYKHCVLYSFVQNELYEDKHRKTFLVRGPINDRGFGKGVQFFHTKGIKPVLDDLRDRLSPFRVEIKYNKAKRLHSIVTYW